jgi:hypothetical protein
MEYIMTITTKRNTRNQSYNGNWYAEVKDSKGRFIVAGNGNTQKEAIAHVESELKRMEREGKI